MDVERLAHRAQALFEQRNFQLAEPLLRAAVAAFPEEENLHGMLVYALAETRGGGEAITAARAMLEAFPASGYAHGTLGWVLTNAGYLEEAIKHVRKAVELDPQDPENYDHLAMCYYELGRPEDALGWADQAVDRDPSIDHYQCTRALILSALGRHREASEALDAARALGGNLAHSIATAGWVALHGADYAVALAHFHDALARRPMVGENHEGAGLALLALGRRSAADSHFVEALRLAPHLRAARRALADPSLQALQLLPGGMREPGDGR